MGVHADHAAVVALHREATVEVVPELGPVHQTVAADDEGLHPDRGACVSEVLEDAAQDDRAGPVGGRIRTADPDEAPVLTVDDGAGSKVERRELLPGVDRVGEAIEACRETEGGPRRVGVDARLQGVAGSDVNALTGRPGRRRRL